jgi:diadenosine tetraphosphate (Ap4A) HIT family hydrolase
LQRADIQHGYTVVIWRGRHVTEPTELRDEEAGGYWLEVLRVARALIEYYQPLKMNYETLGNSLPHLHTHLVPRYQVDPAPGQPFPLAAQLGGERKADDSRVEREARELRSLLAPGDPGSPMPTARP